MNNYYQIQHLDVKPQNLFLVFNHIKVADFGLAKVLEGVRATVTGGVTPVYAAPETFEGWVSRFSDQYSLAIVFQELLTGTRPFNGTNTRQLLMQHINGTPELAPLPVNDRPVIGRALDKTPDQRWPSCTELVRALKLGELPGPSTQTTTPPAIPNKGSLRPASIGSIQAGGTMPAPADSIQATRMASPDPLVARERTPTPGTLPPLVKPGQGPNAVPTPSQYVSPPGSGLRLVTPAVGGDQAGRTLNRPAILQTGRMGTLGIAPPEKSGDGALFPALIVAIGQTGRCAVEELKRAIADRYGSPERTPNIRILYVDTDPEDVSTSQSLNNPAALTRAK